MPQGVGSNTGVRVSGRRLQPAAGFFAASADQLGEDRRVLDQPLDQPLANVVAGFAEGFRRLGDPLSLTQLAELASAAGPAMQAVTIGNIIAAAQRLPPDPTTPASSTSSTRPASSTRPTPASSTRPTPASSPTSAAVRTRRQARQPTSASSPDLAFLDPHRRKTANREAT